MGFAMTNISVIIPIYNMEKYLKRSGASHIYKTSKDQLRHLVDKNGFEQSFNDGLKKLSKEAQSTKKHKQMGK